MNTITRNRLDNGKRRILRRLDPDKRPHGERPIFSASNIHYEVAARGRGTAFGGIGAMHLVARKIGIIEAIDRQLILLKVHLPYHESDHVLNIAYNALCDGDCLEDIELRRQDEVFLNALGASRIPDPTTAGDFCRRFFREHIETLLDIYNETSLGVWRRQPAQFFDRATIDMDGALVETTGECKEGMDIAYDGTWGYHVLLLTLAETGEVLRLVNRPGNRPSQEGAGAEVDRVIALCRRAGFRRIVLRGDTKFSQSDRLDGWNAQPDVRFYFGFEAAPNLQRIAQELPDDSWDRLDRAPRWTARTAERQRPDRVKDEVVRRREFEVLRLEGEEVCEFAYQPTECQESYRMVVVRKRIAVERGQTRLFADDHVRYFFTITNDWESSGSAVAFEGNKRCDQENIIEQLRNGVRTLHAAVNTLNANWAYMVMTSLAWNLKSWSVLLLPEPAGRWCERHREEKATLLGMEFKKFRDAWLRLPCQIVRAGRRLVYRLLSWNPWQAVLFRLLGVLRC